MHVNYTYKLPFQQCEPFVMEQAWQDLVSLLVELITEGGPARINIDPKVPRDKIKMAVAEVLHRLRFRKFGSIYQILQHLRRIQE
jgi:hypothetical protein